MPHLGGVHSIHKIVAVARGPVIGRFCRAVIATVLVGGLLGASARPSAISAADPSPDVTPLLVDPIGDPIDPPTLVPTTAPSPTPDPIGLASPAAVPTVPVLLPGPPTYKIDLFDARGLRWQEPDETACTAASTMSMLNMISYYGVDPTLKWKPAGSVDEMEKVLVYERAHMTMAKTSEGSDPHGWRNALNYFGWGSINAGVYVDAAYPSFETAAKAAVLALAKTKRPVGILVEWGAHAEYMTGYIVTGDNPESGSSAFNIVGVYITDPHQADHHRDSWVTAVQWKLGYWRLRFTDYEQVDSLARDKVSGRVAAWKEWLDKWVIIAPVK
jgi:hypothetical protein